MRVLIQLKVHQEHCEREREKGKRGQKGEKEQGGGDLPELYSLLLPEYVLIPTPLEEITEATDASSPTSSVHLREGERERKARSEGRKRERRRTYLRRRRRRRRTYLRMSHTTSPVW